MSKPQLTLSLLKFLPLITLDFMFATQSKLPHTTQQGLDSILLVIKDLKLVVGTLQLMLLN